MRAPDLLEVVIAVGAAVTVIGAIVGILYRVTRGNADAERVEKLKAELVAAQKKD
jgi:Asp-tRNA(Asn)/Glu-tRNA(Gln) amidotransferase B subunit